MIKWEIKGREFGNCNCDYGCPYQFNALPTHGNCWAVVGIRILASHPRRPPMISQRIRCSSMLLLLRATVGVAVRHASARHRYGPLAALGEPTRGVRPARGARRPQTSEVSHTRGATGDGTA